MIKMTGHTRVLRISERVVESTTDERTELSADLIARALKGMPPDTFGSFWDLMRYLEHYAETHDDSVPA